MLPCHPPRCVSLHLHLHLLPCVFANHHALVQTAARACARWLPGGTTNLAAAWLLLHEPPPPPPLRTHHKPVLPCPRAAACAQDYVLAQFPHGVFPVGQVLAGAIIAQTEPATTAFCLAASATFNVPIWRHVNTWLGAAPATRAAFWELMTAGLPAVPPPRMRWEKAGASGGELGLLPRADSIPAYRGGVDMSTDLSLLLMAAAAAAGAAEEDVAWADGSQAGDASEGSELPGGGDAAGSAPGSYGTEPGCEAAPAAACSALADSGAGPTGGPAVGCGEGQEVDAACLVGGSDSGASSPREAGKGGLSGATSHVDLAALERLASCRVRRALGFEGV
jgi:hypothetical protein